MLKQAKRLMREVAKLEIADTLISFMKPTSVYVSYPVFNEAAVATWSKKNLNIPDAQYKELHITTVYSKKPIVVDAKKISSNIKKGFTLAPNTNRSWEIFGDDENVLVLKLAKSEILPFVTCFKYFESLGASFDYPSYVPHLTFAYTYNRGKASLKDLPVYTGKLVFGNLKIAELNED